MTTMKPRRSKIKRHTLETKISIRLNLDGKGKSAVKTGIPFFDHMLTLFAKHAVVDLQMRCDGDLAVDAHHTVEDCGIALGQAFATALGDKRGIRRYGHGFHPKNPFTGEAYVPMDECLARCVVDFSGRPHLVWRGLDKFSQKKISGAEKNRTPPARSGLDSRANFSRALRTNPAAICIWNCFTATSRITLSRRCSRRLRARWTPRAGTTRASPASCRARRGNFDLPAHEGAHPAPPGIPTPHGARMASVIPWMIFLSAGQMVASTPPSCGRAASPSPLTK